MGGQASSLLEEVRACLDDDLDTPGALAAIDRAAAAGTDVTDSATLLGVDLSLPIGPR
jgi:L-cysteine:1D-myo-inositol 2-amino-2-deoxy-alpha-D-glucopyranoside ligase